jgi:hypothetical protein
MSKSLPSPKRLPSARLLEAGLRAGRQMANESQSSKSKLFVIWASDFN